MFKTGSPVQGKNFLDRTKHLPKFKMYLDMQQHVVIKAPRRFGKTSLIKHVFEEIGGYSYVYIDIRRSVSLASLTKIIIDKSFEFSKIPSFIQKSKESMMELMRSISSLEIKGIAEITLEKIEKSVDEMELFLHSLDVLNSIAQTQNINIKFILDEFQDIVTLGGKDVLEKFRSVAQHHQNITYVFLGSVESMMRSIFEEKQSGFFHFARVMNLDGLDTNEVLQASQAFFIENNISYDVNLESLITFLEGHPDYTMQTLQRLYMSMVLNDKKVISDAECHSALRDAFMENMSYLEELIVKTKVKKHYFEVLNAIANNSAPDTAIEARNEHRIKVALEDMGLVSKVGRGNYIVSDIFLKILLQQSSDSIMDLQNLELSYKGR